MAAIPPRTFTDSMSGRVRRTRLTIDDHSCFKGSLKVLVVLAQKEKAISSQDPK